MYKFIGAVALAAGLVAAVAQFDQISAADTSAPATPPAAAPAAGAAAPAPLSKEELMKPMKPLERANSAPKGTLKNPYTDNPEAIAEGKKFYFGKSCNGCHGGGGGGGMCPPLTNTVWVYGSDDDTLFRLVSYGTDELKKHGYSRKGTESVVGPMPPFGELIDSDQELWKIIAWIRTLYKGPPERRNW
jgi:mono/diheme cytochrome c family protein